MASSMLLRRSSAAASNLLKSKFLNPLRSESLAPAATRSFNTNAHLRDSDDDERSLDIDRRPQTGVRRREFPPSFFSDAFDPFSPTRSISQVLNLIDQLAENAPRGGAGFAGGLRRGWDAKEDKDALHLRVEMPGLGKEDVRISVEENTLIIQGEVGEKEAAEEGEDSGRRRYSSRIELTPKLYKVDAVKAEMKNGVLKVSVPKVKEEERRDVFQVKVD